MQLIDEIIEILSSEKPSLENALIKAQVLAHRLGELELRAWVDAELKGYGAASELPPYRVLSISVMGTITNGVYTYNDHPLPLAHLGKELRERFETSRITQSIAVIEHWATNDDLTVVIAPELYKKLGGGLDKQYWVERAWGKHSVGAMLQILVEVRSRLLDFALKVSDSLPSDVVPETLKQASQEAAVSETFRNAVFGNNTTIVLGSGSIQGVSNVVVQNDFESLVKALRSQSVPETDIQELQTAIQEDSGSAENQAKQIGPRVRNWMSGMLGKAGSATWSVTLEAAGSILAAAIAKYYGFGA